MNPTIKKIRLNLSVVAFKTVLIKHVSKNATYNSNFYNDNVLSEVTRFFGQSKFIIVCPILSIDRS
jgi:hypothetical protein